MLSKLLQQAAGNAGAEALYVEDVFSTYLYTGNSSTQTITNGIDLAGEGGLVWCKWRSGVLGSSNNALFDTTRGVNNMLYSDSTNAQMNTGTGSNASLSAFNTNGFSLGLDQLYGRVNYPGTSMASWTFRKAKKFFDVVTYTGNGTSGRTVAHNLGSVPGCIIVKRTDTTSDWAVYHRGVTGYPEDYNSTLNTSAATVNDQTFWYDTAPTSSVFSLGTNDAVNASGGTYVAYIFAHNAGGFGEDGTENVISCGGYNGTGTTTVSVSLGFEPQWILIKKSSGTTFTDGSASWCIFDNMRGIPTGSSDPCLYANLAGDENSEGTGNFVNVTATGFEVPSTGNLTNQSGCSYIYIAIRRGPMKTPESGTEVFGSNAVTSTGSNLDVTNNINMASGSLVISHRRNSTSNTQWFDNLRGPNRRLKSNSTDPEDTLTTSLVSWNMDGFTIGTQYGSTETQVFWSFKRAPGFFDVVAYTGDFTNPRTINHNLGVAPEIIITKRRTGADIWLTGVNFNSSNYNLLFLESTSATLTLSYTARYKSQPTATSYTVDQDNSINGSGETYIAYLFATCPGVSKVGSYTGSGTTKQIDCGFSSGARFVMIKRTDSTGDWYVWDSARGIVAGNDPYLLLNSAAAEVTSTDYIDTYSAGFEISSTAPAAINANGGSFIYLAIA